MGKRDKAVVQAFKVQQVVALVSAVSAAAVLFVGLSGSAKAAEERLHSTTQKVFGIIPPGEGKSASSAKSLGSASVETAMKTGSRPGRTAGNEPKIEDPPLPSYDGPSAGNNTMASNDGVGTSGIN